MGQPAGMHFCGRELCCPSRVPLISRCLCGQEAAEPQHARGKRGSEDLPWLLESVKSSRKRRRGLGFLLSMGEPVVVLGDLLDRARGSAGRDLLCCGFPFA